MVLTQRLSRLLGIPSTFALEAKPSWPSDLAQSANNISSQLHSDPLLLFDEENSDWKSFRQRLSTALCIYTRLRIFRLSPATRFSILQSLSPLLTSRTLAMDQHGTWSQCVSLTLTLLQGNAYAAKDRESDEDDESSDSSDDDEQMETNMKLTKDDDSPSLTTSVPEHPPLSWFTLWKLFVTLRTVHFRIDNQNDPMDKLLYSASQKLHKLLKAVSRSISSQQLLNFTVPLGETPELPKPFSGAQLNHNLCTAWWFELRPILFTESSPITPDVVSMAWEYIPRTPLNSIQSALLHVDDTDLPLLLGRLTSFSGGYGSIDGNAELIQRDDPLLLWEVWTLVDQVECIRHKLNRGDNSPAIQSAVILEAIRAVRWYRRFSAELVLRCTERSSQNISREKVYAALLALRTALRLQNLNLSLVQWMETHVGHLVAPTTLSSNRSSSSSHTLSVAQILEGIRSPANLSGRSVFSLLVRHGSFLSLLIPTVLDEELDSFEDTGRVQSTGSSTSTAVSLETLSQTLKDFIALYNPLCRWVSSFVHTHTKMMFRLLESFLSSLTRFPACLNALSDTTRRCLIAPLIDPVLTVACYGSISQKDDETTALIVRVVPLLAIIDTPHSTESFVQTELLARLQLALKTLEASSATPRSEAVARAGQLLTETAIVLTKYTRDDAKPSLGNTLDTIHKEEQTSVKNSEVGVTVDIPTLSLAPQFLACALDWVIESLDPNKPQHLVKLNNALSLAKLFLHKQLKLRNELPVRLLSSISRVNPQSSPRTLQASGIETGCLLSWFCTEESLANRFLSELNEVGWEFVTSGRSGNFWRSVLEGIAKNTQQQYLQQEQSLQPPSNTLFTLLYSLQRSLVQWMLQEEINDFKIIRPRLLAQPESLLKAMDLMASLCEPLFVYYCNEQQSNAFIDELMQLLEALLPSDGTYAASTNHHHHRYTPQQSVLLARAAGRLWATLLSMSLFPNVLLKGTDHLFVSFKSARRLVQPTVLPNRLQSFLIQLLKSSQQSLKNVALWEDSTAWSQQLEDDEILWTQLQTSCVFLSFIQPFVSLAHILANSSTDKMETRVPLNKLLVNTTAMCHSFAQRFLTQCQQQSVLSLEEFWDLLTHVQTRISEWIQISYIVPPTRCTKDNNEEKSHSSLPTAKDQPPHHHLTALQSDAFVSLIDLSRSLLESRFIDAPFHGQIPRNRHLSSSRLLQERHHLQSLSETEIHRLCRLRILSSFPLKHLSKYLHSLLSLALFTPDHSVRIAAQSLTQQFATTTLQRRRKKTLISSESQPEWDDWLSQTLTDSLVTQCSPYDELSSAPRSLQAGLLYLCLALPSTIFARILLRASKEVDSPQPVSNDTADQTAIAAAKAFTGLLLGKWRHPLARQSYENIHNQLIKTKLSFESFLINQHGLHKIESIDLFQFISRSFSRRESLSQSTLGELSPLALLNILNTAVPSSSWALLPMAQLCLSKDEFISQRTQSTRQQKRLTSLLMSLLERAAAEASVESARRREALRTVFRLAISLDQLHSTAVHFTTVYRSWTVSHDTNRKNMSAFSMEDNTIEINMASLLSTSLILSRTLR